jgi:hypothetical protein
MKKFGIVLVLALLACGLVFADGPFTITLDAIADAFYMRSFSGDYAQKNPEIAGSPYKYQGGGDIKSFQTSAFDDGLNARIKFDYTGDLFGGLLQLRADTGTAILGDWQAWLRLGKYVRVLTGNMAQRGQVAQYDSFDDFLSTELEYFGILYPVWKVNPPAIGNNNFDATRFPYGYDTPDANYGYAELSGTETSDLFTPAGASARQTMGFLLDFSLAPLTLTASVGGLYESLSRPFKDPWESGGNTLNDWDNIYDPLESTGINFGFRAEGAEIADMVSAAAVYKYARSTLSKLEAEDTNNKIEEKVGNHTFGLYVNVTPPVEGLGISAGYSGLIKTWENEKYKDTVLGSISGQEDHYLSMTYRETLFPYYSGIDLRAIYTGIDRLTLTLNNNVSFASMNGTPNRDEQFAYGWAYSGMLNEADDGNASTPYLVPLRTEYYTGVYNALAVRCEITQALAADLQVGNRLAIFTLEWEEDSLKALTNSLGAYAGVTYTVYENDNFHASIRGGFALTWNNYSYQDTPPSLTRPVHKTGYTEFGIPIAVKVEF